MGTEKLRALFSGKKPWLLMLLGILGMVLILISSFVPSGETAAPAESEDPAAAIEARLSALISQIDGVGTSAQMTLVMGSDGSGLPHPDWMENLKLAVALQNNILRSYPTLMRPILLRNSRYNQHATTGSLLVEVGTEVNTVSEAVYAGQLVGQALVPVLEATVGGG